MKKGKFLRSIIIILIVLCAACSAEQPVAVEGEVEAEAAPLQTKIDGKVNAAEASMQEDESMYIVNDSVNMRQRPSTDEQIEDVLYEGEEVRFLSADGSWFEVSNGEAKGFVHQSYLDLPDQESESTGRDVLILMYHAIDDYKGSGSKELYVTPENFESQMQYLKSEGFTPITFADLDHLKGIEKPVLITLDDGYKNNMNAYYILQKLKDDDFPAKATIFMIGNKIDQKHGLSTEQLKEITASGIISIQSHTVTHPSLPTIGNYEQELGEIKNQLEGITGEKVIALAYPAGKYDDKVIEETKKYYDYAVTIHQGIADMSESPYEMKRIRVNYTTSIDGFEYMVNQ